MKIGIYFSSGKRSGGVYQYSLTFLKALLEIPGNEYIVFSSPKSIPDYIRKSRAFEIVNTPIKTYGFTSKTINGTSYLLTYLATRLRAFSILNIFSSFFQRKNIKFIDDQHLDLIFYPTSSNLSFLSKTPSVVAVHDLMHKAHPEFRELSAVGRWESREFVYRNISKYAYRILVDSKVGKEDVINYYKTNKNKIVILHFLPPPYLNNKIRRREAGKICRSLGLPGKFIFYPARFWPHKNHLNLVKAVDILKKKGISVNLILTGSKDADYSSYDCVFSFVKEHDLGKQIFYLGYVDNREISAIYKTASAMVMPTFLGPTNIPVLEAWSMGTPVIYSNIRGCREQLGNAGLLINPYSPRDIADKIEKIYTHPKLAMELVRKGKIKIKQWTFKDFTRRIKEIIDIYEKEKGLISKDN